MFEGVLPVLLLGAHVLLQQAEDVARLQGTRREDKMRLTAKSRGRTAWCFNPKPKSKSRNQSVTVTMFTPTGQYMGRVNSTFHMDIPN